jgi:hypothetical protein
MTQNLEVSPVLQTSLYKVEKEDLDIFDNILILILISFKLTRIFKYGLHFGTCHGHSRNYLWSLINILCNKVGTYSFHLSNFHLLLDLSPSES